VFLSVKSFYFSTHEGIPVYRSNKKPSSSSVPCYAMLLDKNLRLSSTPTKPVKHMPRRPWDNLKTILCRGGRRKKFNPVLMNKLIRIKWVSEWVSAIRLPPKLMDDVNYVLREQKGRFLYFYRISNRPYSWNNLNSHLTFLPMIYVWISSAILLPRLLLSNGDGYICLADVKQKRSILLG